MAKIDRLQFSELRRRAVKRIGEKRVSKIIARAVVAADRAAAERLRQDARRQLDMADAVERLGWGRCMEIVQRAIDGDRVSRNAPARKSRTARS